MIILHRHMRELGYCNKGGRAYCKRYNLDWSKFVTEGLDEEEFLKLDNAMANKMVEHAHGR